MKADWILRIELANFFHKHAELRARTSRGLTRDTIYRAVFSKTLRREFTQAEIRQAEHAGFIQAEQINADGKKTVYLWLEKQCEIQPVRYKRWLQQAKAFLEKYGVLR